MSRGKINLQAADGAVIGLVVPDGLTSGERQIALGANLSGVTAYHLLQGNLAVSNSTITQGFNTTLYTGNGATQAVNTGIDMDTQWGDTTEEKFGGLVWGKSRSTVVSNTLFDTVRGVNNRIITNNTNAAAVVSETLTSFNSTGFTLGSTSGYINDSAATYASWNFQTTHRVSGTTNHGKAYTCHYNPFTGFTMVKYEGSGLAGHEIQHHLGRKLDIAIVKNLTNINDWAVDVSNPTGIKSNQLTLNTTNAVAVNLAEFSEFPNSAAVTVGTHAYTNASANTYIMYGWANSYIDESNKLIGNYEIGVYQGTGAVGNKIKTRGKPAWIMVKRLDSTGNWQIVDNQRGDNWLQPNLSNTGAYADYSDFNEYEFIIKTTDATWNASGGQYLYMVAYDNDNGSGKSKYPKATDSSQLQINALIPFANGVDGNGAKNTILSKNETITGLAYTAGKNYVYCDKNGNYGVTPYKPRYLKSELVRTFATEAPDYYDVVKNKWFSTYNGETITNGNFNINTNGWSTDAGMTLSVSNGMLVTTATVSSSGYTYQSITTVIGKTYRLKAFINNVNMYQYGLLINDSSNTLFTETLTATGSKTYDVTFVAQSTTTNIKFFRNSSAAGQTLMIDNVTCFATDIVPITEITNSRNYLNHIVHADNVGRVLYVEELPKIEYKDVVKANEFKGKNACTAWVNFDGTTTPPTIRDSHNVSSVVRTSTGNFDVYFSSTMDNSNYCISGIVDGTANSTIVNMEVGLYATNKVSIGIGLNTSGAVNSIYTNVQIFGGKN